MEEEIVIWEAPKIEKPEFRLYYDSLGKVICYTCEKLEGDYIVVDATTYAESRPDLMVIDGEIIRTNKVFVISKLVPHTEGTSCHKEDLSILAEGNDTQKWEVKIKNLQ